MNTLFQHISVEGNILQSLVISTIIILVIIYIMYIPHTIKFTIWNAHTGSCYQNLHRNENTI